MKRIFSVFIIVVLICLFSQNVALAGVVTISSSTITGNTTADLVVGAKDADYNIMFITDAANNATSVSITFPTNYSITQGAIGTADTVILSSSSIAGKITIKDTDYTISAATGTASTIFFGFATTTGISLASGTVSFRLLLGVRNATTSGATATTSITINAAPEVAASANTLTLTPATTTKLAFTTQAADSGATHGSIKSGLAFETQPIIATQDTWGNTSTTQTGIVTLTTNGVGTLSGTTLTKSLVSGVANFSANAVKYTAVEDQETFRLTGTLGTFAQATSSLLTADSVATKLVFTTQPAGDAVSTKLLPTQPVVAAENADGLLDTDFVSNVSIVPSTGAGVTLNSTVAAIAGVATFTNLKYESNSDAEAFVLSAISDSLTAAVANSTLVGYFFRGAGGSYNAPTLTISTPTISPSTPTTPTPTTTTPTATPITPVITSSNPSLDSLISQLKALIQQAASMGISIPAGAQAYFNPSKLSDIAKNLYFGSVGDEVKSLQQFLNSQGFAVASAGAGSPGSETTRFGALTRAALAKFQASVGISPASGYLGPLTKQYLKSIGF